MAVKTKFNKTDFRKILSGYNLGEYVSHKPFKLGAVQTNLLLITEKGKFVLRYYENRSKEYALFEAHLTKYLSGRGYPCPAPVANVGGRLVGIYRNKPFAIYEFMEGRHVKKPDPKLIASALGKLHSLTKDYVPRFHSSRDKYDPGSCWNGARKSVKKITNKSEAKERLAWLKAELSVLQMSRLPKGVCHCDMHYSNFLYKNGRISAVLDFDDASYVPMLYDLANMIYFWAWPDKGKLNFEKAKMLLKEYQKFRKLELKEKEHLYDMLKMVIFMSVGWFLHDAKDFQNNKRKIEFLDSIGREGFYGNIFG